MKEDKKLFTEFKDATYQEWHDEAVKLLKGAPFEKKMFTNTVEGITLKPIYNKEDVDFDISLPGFDGNLRGTQSQGYRTKSWDIAQEIPAMKPECFNKTLLDVLNKGQSTIEIKLNGLSANAKDADEATCNCKNKGLSISTVEDFRKALKDVETSCIDINIHTQTTGTAIAALLYASQEGKQLSGGIYFDPISTLAKKGKIKKCLKCVFEDMYKLTSFNAKNMPKMGSIGVDTMKYSNAGASAVEELGIALATGVKYIKEMLEKGMDINEVAPLVRFRLSLGSNFFMEIAKLRAARMLWAKVIEEFGGNEESQKFRVNVRTAKYNKTVYDPYVNMLRTTTEAFSGVIGGCDSMTIGAFDEIIRKPDENSQRIARNQQIILQEECNLTEVIDPAGGSYFVENLTNEVALKSWEFFVKIEQAGGIVEALKSSLIQNSIKETAQARRKAYNSRRSSVVGTNNYANITEKLLEKTSVCSKAREELAQQVKVDRKEVEINVCKNCPSEAMATLIDAALKGASVSALNKALCLCGKKHDHDKADNKHNLEVEPLNIHRGVEHFEELRNKSSQYKEANGFGPKLFLATMGPLLQHKARADFIRAFFEVGGFEVIYPNGFDTPESAAQEFEKSGAKYAVICSTDATYPELVPSTTQAIKAKVSDATVYMAGIPAADSEEAYKAAGLDGSISIKSNNYETLKTMLTALGVL